MIMYFKMMKISAVCVWLVKRAVCSQQHLPTFLLSPSFSCLFLLPFPVLTFPKQIRDGKQQYNQALWNYL